MTPPPLPLQLTLTLGQTEVLVQIENTSDHAVRVWQTGNSWGGHAWSLHLTGAGGRSLSLSAANATYTRNLPRFIEVPAHARRELRLKPSSREWSGDAELAPLQGAPLQVQVVLDTAPSPEATQYGVAVGHVESPALESKPPHAWLFGASPRP